MMCGSEKGTMKCWRTQHVTSIRHRHQNLRKSWDQFWWSFDGISIRLYTNLSLWWERAFGDGHASEARHQSHIRYGCEFPEARLAENCWKSGTKLPDLEIWENNPRLFHLSPCRRLESQRIQYFNTAAPFQGLEVRNGRNENGTLHPKSMSSDSVWNQPRFPRKCLQPEFRGASIGASGTASCIPQVLTQNNALKEDRQNETQLCKGGCSFKDHAGSVSSVWSFTRHRHVETPSFFQGARDLGDHWPQTGAWRRMTWGLPNFWASVGFSPEKWMVFDKND